MKLFLVLFLALAARAERDIVDVEGGGGSEGKDDVEKSDVYQPNYCFTQGKQCPGEDISAVFEVSARACSVTCNRNLQCGSAFYGDDHKCHLRSVRCTKAQLVSAAGIQLYRLKREETCGPETGDQFKTAAMYGRRFCRLVGKRCPHKGLDQGSLYKRPLNLRPWMTCLLKCAKIRSCTGVDFYTEERKACDLRKQMCSDDELVEDFTENYVRLEEGATSCGDGRDEVEVPGCGEEEV